MPDPSEYEDEKTWMEACVPKMIDEGKDQDQAVAACMNMWSKKSLDLSLDALKVGARNSATDAGRLQQIHDLAVENGAMCPDKPETTMIPTKAEDSENLIAYGGAIKAIGEDKIGGQLVTFGNPDQPDISKARDYFDAMTNFGIEPGEKKKTPVWFNHRMPIETKTGKPYSIKEQIGEGEMWLGDDGVFIEAVLYNRKRYEKILDSMGWSSGTAEHLVRRTPVKSAHHVDYWPLGLDASITPMPAEPRNNVIPLKSLGDLLPPVPLEGDDAPAQADNQPIKHEVNMEITQEVLQSMLDQAAQTALKALPAEPVKSNVVVVKDEADQGFATPGEYFAAVKMAALYPGQEDPRLKPLKATGLSEGVPADGGYLLNPQMSNQIIERMLDTSQILSRVSRDPVAGNTMLYNGVDESTHVGSLFGGVITYWLAEGGTKTSSKPKFYQVELKLKKVAALCYATDEQLEDTPALSSWLTRNVPAALRFAAENAIVNGDGVGKPLGIANSPAKISVLRTDANNIQLSDITRMWSQRWAGISDYVWLVSSSATAYLNAMTASTAPVYMPAGNVAGSPFGTLYGKPVVETEYAAAAKSAGDVQLVALSQYQVIDKGGVQTASSIHVQFVTDETAFRFVYRIDGAPLWNSSLTLLNGDVVSPFLSLSAAST